MVLANTLVYHHLGLDIDRERGDIRWLSGAPYRWNLWRPPDARDALHFRGDPAFTSNAINRTHTWWIMAVATPYLVIEWAA
ncbi:MAG TPA: hypothetical protein PK794_00100 [Armatimonadota bacterium]|nr:hypothetical protein [Armatimonadota bacterium]